MPIEDDKISISVDAITIRRDLPNQATFTFTCHNKRTVSIALYPVFKHSSTSYQNRFSVNTAGYSVSGNASYNFTITIQPLNDITRTEDLPTSLDLVMGYWGHDWEAYYIPIRYEPPIAPDETVNRGQRRTGSTQNAANANVCRHCDEELAWQVYTCDTCSPSWKLCSTCAQTWGRESHIARCGDNHQFQSVLPGLKCSVCKKDQSGDSTYLLCQTCSGSHPERAVICSDCAVTYTNILNHKHAGSNSNQIGGKRSFTWVKPTSYPLREPEPYGVDFKTRITCQKCFSRIRHEFFRCLHCAETFDVCDRCADYGELANHGVHDFNFLAPLAPRSPNMPQSADA